MELIIILIAAAFFLLYIALNKKDVTLIYFAGFLIMLNGLSIMNYNLPSVSNLYIQGAVYCFLAIYLMLRSSIELIKDDDGIYYKEIK